MFYLSMDNKGFTDNEMSIETPNDAVISEKPLKMQKQDLSE